MLSGGGIDTVEGTHGSEHWKMTELFAVFFYPFANGFSELFLKIFEMVSFGTVCLDRNECICKLFPMNTMKYTPLIVPIIPKKTRQIPTNPDKSRQIPTNEFFVASNIGAW